MASASALDARDRAQTEAVVSALLDVLHEDLVGVWLHGSAVLGSLRPRSDLDLLAVSRRRLTRRERDRIVEELLAISLPWGSPRGRSIELTAFAASAIRPWRYPPPTELQFGEWWRASFERGQEPWTSPDADAALLVAMALIGDVTLHGPRAAEVFEPVPAADVRAALLASAEGIVAHLASDTTNVVLTLARIWHSITTGELTSKDVAADRVLPQVDEDDRRILARARDVYLGHAEDRWDDESDALGTFVEHLAARIRAE